MSDVKKTKKVSIITLSVILGIAVIISVFFGIYYMCADALVYHYVDLPDAYIDGVNYPDIESESDYPRRYPFFGNPFTISKETGNTYHLPINAGEKYLHVYAALNEPIGTWITYLGMRYKNDARVDYTVEQDDEYIKVNFTGTLTENGETVPIEQSFVFRITDVSLFQAPYWENKDEISEGHKEFLIYCRKEYPDNVETPDWILNHTY